MEEKRQKFRVGVAGCGQIARVLHIPGYANDPRSELAAFYNRSAERVRDLGAAFPEVSIFDDYDAFLEEGNIQAVSICTPNVLHAEMAVKAAEKGINVLVEKPMAMTLKEARAMIDAADRNRVLLMVGHTHRYLPCYRLAKQLLRQGLLGYVYQIKTSFAYAGPWRWNPRAHWFYEKELSGSGVVGDLGIHKADMLLYLTEQKVKSLAAFAHTSALTGIMDNASVILKLERGTVASLLLSWTEQGKSANDFVISGEKGSLYINAEKDDGLVFCKASGERISYPVEAGIPLREGAWNLDEIKSFLDGIAGEGEDFVDGEEGYRALEICVGIERSAHSGQVLQLPLDQ
jgi:UDP-N-acetylglucosamine 3-dehydrogenase